MEATSYHFFQVKGAPYFIHAERLTTGRVPPPVHRMLNKYRDTRNGSVSGELDGLLRDIEVVRPDDDNRDRAPAPAFSCPPVSELSLFLTQKCNLRCVYCFGGDAPSSSGEPMTQDTAFQSVDWLIGQSGALKYLYLHFFGGEPLLAFSTLKAVVNYARKQASLAGKTFSFSLTTNATLLDDDKIEFLRANSIKPVISFDGLRQAQDDNRPFRNGTGSYDTILPRLKKLLSAMPQAECIAVIWGDTAPAEVRHALSRIGFSMPRLNAASPCLSGCGAPVTNWQRDLAALSKLEEQESERLIEHIKKRRTMRIRQSHRDGKLFTALSRFLTRKRFYFPCPAGRNRLSVAPNGDLYNCHRLVDHDAFRMGSVIEGVVDRGAYFTSPVQALAACSRCFAKYLCGGGCLHDNLGMTGSATEAAPDFCRMVQRRAELAAAIACRLSERDIAYLGETGIVPQWHRIFDIDFEVLQ